MREIGSTTGGMGARTRLVVWLLASVLLGAPALSVAAGRPASCCCEASAPCAVPCTAGELRSACCAPSRGPAAQRGPLADPTPRSSAAAGLGGLAPPVRLAAVAPPPPDHGARVSPLRLSVVLRI